MTDDENQPQFLFMTCQVGAEAALKAELAQRWPALRFAFSRPGFLTFKIPPALSLAEDFELHSIFARTYGFSLGKVSGENPAAMAVEVWALADDLKVQRLHVWQRDAAAPGYRGFEPAITELAEQARQAIVDAAPSERGDAFRERLAEQTHAGQLVLDCVLVEPDQWWVGYHQARSLRSRWPGAIPPLHNPDMVSRAFLKMQEALAWSQLPIRTGQACVEIGSAPGGASQALLAHGLKVTGVDPADMDPRVVSHPDFVHLKKRGADIRRREYRPFRWLTADINLAPNYTLDTVESIVTHPEVHIEGMLLTLKLIDWKLAEEIPAYLDRIQSWGFADVRARQLAYNRQEICVAALRQRSLRRRAPCATRSSVGVPPSVGSSAHGKTPAPPSAK